MTNISNLPRPEREPPEHITVPIEEFAEKLGGMLADAEDKAARLTLIALSVPAATQSDFNETNAATNAVRARLFAAHLKLMMKGIAV
jgi:hypothetical protein